MSKRHVKRDLPTVRIETRPIAELRPWDRNPRTITPKALAGLRASVERFGLVQSLVVNERTGHLVGGHQRLKVLQETGQVATQVMVVDLPEEDEKALNVALNNPHIGGEFTDDLQPILAEIETENAELFEKLCMDELMEEKRTVEPAEGEDDVPDASADPVTRRGDLWVLGRHRLLCGDSTSADDVSRLLVGAVPLMMVTDPPYGVEYEPAWRDVAGLGGKANGRVQADDRPDWREAYALFPGDVAYVWHASWFIGDVLNGLAVCGFERRALIIWAKQQIAISRGHYHWQHEPCWYAVRKGCTAKWCGDRKQSTVWQIKNRSGSCGTKDDADTNHGTQKPVECMRRPMLNHGAGGGGVYDPFCGSGTSIIAAETGSRSCYAMDIDPVYVDVAVRRWQNFAGQLASMDDGRLFDEIAAERLEAVRE